MVRTNSREDDDICRRNLGGICNVDDVVSAGCYGVSDGTDVASSIIEERDCKLLCHGERLAWD